MRFTGRTALVTGAGSGIGAATARRLAAEGAAVLVADIDDQAGKAVADETGGEFRHLDALSEVDWAAAVDGLDRLDVLHANVGRHTQAALHELTTEQWSSIVDLSLRSAFLGVRACIEALRAAQGSIVLTSSVHALVGLPGAAPYAAAKGGLVALTRQLAVEYGPEVRVNAVLPGPIRTAAWQDPDNTSGPHVARTIAGRMGTADEVAAVVAFLASSDASYVTGAAIPVDGGWSVRGL